MEQLSRMKLDLEAVVEDARDEVQSLEIQRSLINSKFVWIVHYHIISESLSGDYSKKILSCSTCVWVPAVKLSLPSSTVVTHSSIIEVIVYAW